MNLIMHFLSELPIAMVMLVLAIIFDLRFWIRYHSEPRSLWTGITLTAGLVFTFLTFTSALASLHSPLAGVLLDLAAFPAVVALLFSPLVLVLVLVISGLNNIRHEGFRLSTALSLVVGLLIIAFVFGWRHLSRFITKTELIVLNYLQAVLLFAILFTSALFYFYVLTSLLNRIPRRNKHYDYIVVLGAGLLEGMRVSPLLAKRIEKGIEMWRKNPGSKLVMSGGRGEDEDLPESCAMREWAIVHGVPSDAILTEEKSTNTHENLQFSWDLMNEDGGAGNVLVVSDGYHVYRALLNAKHMGFACDGVGSRVKLYFSLNATVREFVAFLAMWKKQYIAAIITAAIVIASSFVVGIAIVGFRSSIF